MRKRGVGTQVVQNPVHRRVELTSLFDDLARAGQEPTTQLLDYRVGPPDEEVARELSLAEDRDVVSIQRLRGANGEPLAVMTNHLPAEIAPDPEELETNGLYQSLRARGVHIRLMFNQDHPAHLTDPPPSEVDWAFVDGNRLRA